MLSVVVVAFRLVISRQLLYNWKISLLFFPENPNEQFRTQNIIICFHFINSENSICFVSLNVNFFQYSIRAHWPLSAFFCFKQQFPSLNYIFCYCYFNIIELYSIVHWLKLCFAPLGGHVLCRWGGLFRVSQEVEMLQGNDQTCQLMMKMMSKYYFRYVILFHLLDVHPPSLAMSHELCMREFWI